LFNLGFLSFNLFLAVIPVIFGKIMIMSISWLIRSISGFIWFFFVPNTLYLLTDLDHLSKQFFKADFLFKFILPLQYAVFVILGILAFIIAVNFLEILIEGRVVKSKKIHPASIFVITVLNFLIGFAIILGGIQRVNSWEVITNPVKVINESLAIFNSQELMLLSIGFGILANIIYFVFRDKIVLKIKKYLKK
jgi:uncharacterized membrane protein